MEDRNGVEKHVERRQVGLVSLDDGPLVEWSQGRRYSLRPVRERSLLYEQAAVQDSRQQRELLYCAWNN